MCTYAQTLPFENIIEDESHREKIIKSYKERKELRAAPNPRGWKQAGPGGSRHQGKEIHGGRGPRNDLCWEKAARGVSSTETSGKSGKYSCWQGSLPCSHPPHKQNISSKPGSLTVHVSLTKTLSAAWVSNPGNSCLWPEAQQG